MEFRENSKLEIWAPPITNLYRIVCNMHYIFGYAYVYLSNSVYKTLWIAETEKSFFTIAIWLYSELLTRLRNYMDIIWRQCTCLLILHTKLPHYIFHNKMFHVTAYSYTHTVTFAHHTCLKYSLKPEIYCILDNLNNLCRHLSLCLKIVPAGLLRLKLGLETPISGGIRCTC